MFIAELHIKELQENLKATKNRVFIGACAEERIKYYEDMLKKYKEKYPEYFI